MDARELLEAGQLEEAARDEHPLFRGLALLELERYDEAARAFEDAPGASESGTMLQLAGAARWLAGERELGAERWISALDLPYDAPAAHLKAPALLWYAGLRIPDSRYVARGSRLLGKAYKPKVSRVWPGPIAGYLLDKVDETSFLEDGYDDERLEARRLCAASFWAGVKSTDPAKAREHFQLAAKIGGPSLVEVEHYLAKGELKGS